MIYRLTTIGLLFVLLPFTALADDTEEGVSIEDQCREELNLVGETLLPGPARAGLERCKQLKAVHRDQEGTSRQIDRLRRRLEQRIPGDFFLRRQLERDQAAARRVREEQKAAQQTIRKAPPVRFRAIRDSLRQNVRKLERQEVDTSNLNNLSANQRRRLSEQQCRKVPVANRARCYHAFQHKDEVDINDFIPGTETEDETTNEESADETTEEESSSE